MKQMKYTAILLCCLLLCSLFCLPVMAQDESSDVLSDAESNTSDVISDAASDAISDVISDATSDAVSDTVSNGSGTVSKLEGTIHAFVTVADDKGKLVLTREQVTVSDVDADGALTVYDALYCAHEAKFQGGASAGFGAEKTQYGLSMTKLWGVANGGSYGYYVNNAAAMSLLDGVKEGDRINAFVYTDTTAFSDTYCFFEKDWETVSEKDELTLTLMGAGYDENWKPVNKPIAGAVILIDGKETTFVTDENGKVTLHFDGTGNCVVSAKKDGQTLVPPVCIVTVEASKPLAGDTSILGWTLLAVISIGGLMALHQRRRGADVA